MTFTLPSMVYPSAVFNKCFLLLLAGLLLMTGSPMKAQAIKAATLYSGHVLQAERLKRREGVYKYTILPILTQQPDTTNEQSFQSALWSISQFMLKNDTTRRIVDTLFKHYGELESSTRRSLMEVVYGLYPTQYLSKVQQLWQEENDDRLLAIMIYYLKRNHPGLINKKMVEAKIRSNQNHFDSSAVLQQLVNSFIPVPLTQKGAIPSLSNLFQYQQKSGCKVIYSLQRNNRDFPGIVIVQNEDGSFVKDSTGRLKTFVQLARSAADLPYFITNGSTPQGAYRIKGTAVSQNNFIGPTPNIQLRLPYEIAGDSFFIHPVAPISNDSVFLETYRNLFPIQWQTTAMMESYYAGKCGRGAIIAHGSTLDPWYYRQQSFYPCTPTLGCLCAKETWNAATGRLIQSDQLDLVNAFLSSPGTDGYLFVINIDDQKRAVTPEDAGALVKAFESKKQK